MSKMKSTNVLIDDIIDELGMDIYSGYEDKRYLIENPLLVAIASACIASFLKGFVNFEELGKKTRTFLSDLIKNFTRREDIRGYTDKTPIEELLLMSTEKSKKLTQKREIYRKGEESLKLALKTFGMPEEIAQQHASNIAILIIENF